ncbi:alpha/beta fold hydrolase [Marinobacteraceae bacterium S3BR75-40.1]
MREQTLVLIGGWGLPVAAIAAVAKDWPGPVIGISLDDTLFAVAEDADDLVRRIIARVGEPAVWAGWSLGGQVAMHAARFFPQQVTGVFTLCSTPCFTRRRGWLAGMPDSIFESFVSRFESEPLRQWQRFLLMQIQGDEQERTARRAFRSWLEHGPGMQPATLSRGLEWLDTWDQRSLWREVAVPALHVFGERDPLIDPGTPEAAALDTRRVVRIEGMAHWPFGQGLSQVQDRLKPEALVK